MLLRSVYETQVQLMSGHKLINILIGAGIVVVVLLAFLLWSRNGAEPVSQEQIVPSENDGRTTRGPIPYDASVPDQGDTQVATDTAVPGLVAPAGPKTSALFRSFSIRAVNNSFSPSKIVVYRGDTVSINITAEDHDYNFVQPDYGFNVLIRKGESKVVEFSATAAGTFTYYCSMCENNSVEGKILITEHDE